MARRRKKKLIKVRKPALRITSKGPKITSPSVRIGGKTGLNISKRGVSGSVRTRYGTFNTKRGVSPRVPGRRRSRSKAKGGGCLPGCGILVMAMVVVPLVGLMLG